MDQKYWTNGIETFKTVYFKKHEKDFLELVEKGQNPKALFIGCSDSRVIPNLITSTSPGDLFVVRNVGNFVPPFKPDNDFHATASGIEYAVNHLEVDEIIVCGHSDCGACKALYEDHSAHKDEMIHTIKWLELGQPAKELALKSVPNDNREELLEATEKFSIIYQLQNLLTYPSVKKRVDQGKLHLHGWYYRIDSGEVEYYDPDDKQFYPLLKDEC
ncbi:carbonic anhydrase [Hydrogenimonas thermophila]|uniref:Carbonic anhydrase n=1 Tax=Hydrogenimonas thermophila TaxID=223786 RepID=A0A1I5R6D8_9BACT|nr:carbonic anhydrase [Hydrogenimonas thermophila]WOE70693.1 carbonic anhydrase [Hydrogenimonas thermophila]WOE73211.1 carbonic anhydrase [Hydrogenimonas thermophila]SFP54079.1 carbonic anhydrase [Hydrogenimonas thermophila]